MQRSRYPRRLSPEVKNAIKKASESNFLSNNIGGTWYRLDWIFNPTNFLKIIEGTYGNDKFGNKVLVENKSNVVYYKDPNPFINKRS